MSDVIITKELLIDGMGACNIGPDFIEANNLWGQPDESVICPALRAAGLDDAADWWLNEKKTEKFVRLNGKEITMGAYQVFNPMTGQHVECLTEEDLKLTMTNIAQQILDSQIIDVCQSISNENGDSTWIKQQIETPYMVVQKP